MSSCCSPKSKGACSATQNTPSNCLACGVKGQPLQVLTVKNLVRGHTRVSPAASYLFCRSPECDVVYFSTDIVFRKADVKVRVGLKEKEGSVPLCYCFDYTREDVERDLKKYGRTEIPERIKAEISAGLCACEVKNPSGRCCLGDVTRAIQEAKATFGG